MTDPLTALTEAGVSIWLDDLSRDRLTSGSLADLVAGDHVSGVTTNPTIIAKAIATGGAYETQVRDLAARGVSAGEALRALTTFDVRWACDVLRPVYDDLVAPGVVNTMPEATLRLVADHGQVPADSIHDHYDQSQEVLDGLRELGIDYDDVVQSLEKDGVAKFDASWDQLGERLVSALRHQSASR